MGVAQNFCCVGGLFSCIGAWGARNISRPASIYLVGTILPYNGADCKWVSLLQAGGLRSGRFILREPPGRAAPVSLPYITSDSGAGWADSQRRTAFSSSRLRQGIEMRSLRQLRRK